MMNRIILISTRLFLIICCFWETAFSSVVISTNVGSIAGLRKEVNIDGQRRTLTEFLGVPYGEDTSGQNRFKRPIPKAHFKTTFNAFTLSPPCMQYANILSNCTTNMTEDCLMLNIYVPHDLGKGVPSSLMAVMIWIHGGAYVSGAAREYNGEVLSSIGEVIIVTINYRLAEFGFLNVGDSRASGNQALWDQHLAIRWVKNNIRAFGGDPHEITIFGESAGSVSVTYQSLFAGNKGLFKKVIAESGSALSYWAFDPNPNPSCLFKFAGCDMIDLDPVECLRRKSTNDLYQILIALQQTPFQICSNRLPSIDHDFVVEKPLDIAFGTSQVSYEAKQFFRSLDIMTGVNDGEGALYIVTLWLRSLRQVSMDNLTVTLSDFENTVVPAVLNVATDRPSNESFNAVKEAILYEYVDWGKPDDNESMRNRLMKLSGDLSFFVATTQILQAHTASSIGDSYQYFFTAEPPLRLLPTPSWFHGANHVDELEYVFGGPFQRLNTFNEFTSRNGLITESDRRLALGMMTAWSNFAKSRSVNAEF